MAPNSTLLDQSTDFAARHLGPRDADVAEMLAVVGADSMEALLASSVPGAIRTGRPLDIGLGCPESQALAELRAMAAKNTVARSFIGMGYYGTRTPAVILRNILENPGWYTQYTPYQAEIAQGRLEALLSFQTLVAELTGLEVANASLLDEGTAAAEAMTLCLGAQRDERRRFLVSTGCHPQTIAVVQSRAEPIGVEVVVSAPEEFALGPDVFAVLVQYPDTDGGVRDYRDLIARTHAVGARVVMAADPLALCLLEPPGALGADVAVGSAQRFGVPMGYGGPHAAFFATRDELKRLVPGRIVGVSRDAAGRPAYRLALQVREQHIRRARATSNICTSQVLLAIIAATYAVYHGPQGLQRIARRVKLLAEILAEGLRRSGLAVGERPVFDTVRVTLPDAGAALARARVRGMNLRRLDADTLTVSLDETHGLADVQDLLVALGAGGQAADLVEAVSADFAAPHARTSPPVTHEVFDRYHSEHELLRYLHRLEARDLSLTTSMIPLGSCTMKLNAAAEMLPVTWPLLSDLHPFAPADQAAGSLELIARLSAWLAEVTGLPGVSLQPNAGSQGELTGLLLIRRWHRERGEPGRTVCLIPESAHGTNPASAVMAGMSVVPVACDPRGDIDLADLRAKATKHAASLAGIMVTYPSTHGVFEEGITQLCEIVHAAGGQVYMDGANMNAQVGLCRPGELGVDVCHLNLHKTFCIPHGGGGPGVGPVAVAEHLRPFLPGHPMVACGGEQAIGPVASAPYGSAGILAIPWMYIRMMGAEGLRRATSVAILNANYLATRLQPYFPVLYLGAEGRCAHELILDLRPLKKTSGIQVVDVAKRLMDYGFHAPTVSWPVAGTLMVEPTESESRQELDRFVETMRLIREEIRDVEAGGDPEDNPLKNAPHTAQDVTAAVWAHPYSRERAAFPAPWTREHKFFPAVRRIDEAYGDRHFVCTCPTLADLADA